MLKARWDPAAVRCRDAAVVGWRETWTWCAWVSADPEPSASVARGNRNDNNSQRGLCRFNWRPFAQSLYRERPFRLYLKKVVFVHLLALSRKPAWEGQHGKWVEVST